LTGPAGATGPIGPTGVAGSADAWGRLGSTGTNPNVNFIGTIDVQPFVMRTGNVQSLRIEPTNIQFNGAPITANLIAGSSANSVTAGSRGATISGGGFPVGSIDPDFGAGEPNRVTDSYGTVSGGYGNQSGDGAGSTSSAGGATVSGGYRNNARGGLSTVGGGYFNTASGEHSTVAGGQFNQARGESSTIGGGGFNTAIGDNSAVGGGSYNCAGGDYSWAGGRRAKVRPASDASDTYACSFLTYPGGNGDQGSFIWADSQAVNFVSTGENQFLVRAEGGMAINTNTPAASSALTVAGGDVAIINSGRLKFGSTTRQMLNLWGTPSTDYGVGVQGSRLYFRTDSNGGFSWFEGGFHNDAADNPGPTGTLRMRLNNVGQLQTTTGTISSLSDARLKDQVHDYAGALDQINALRPVRYHYRDAGKAAFQPEGLHLGFLAQEMQQVFPEWVSEGEDGYLMLSMRGFEAVAVRAMQELSTENAELRARLDALEARLK